MKNLKQTISICVISILLMVVLVACNDETTKDPNKAFIEKVGKIIKENPNANLNDLSLKGVTSLEGLFKGKNFNGDISKWDVSKVTNFKSMFEGSTFNSDISKWDISSAQNMQFMFKDNETFDQNLSSWKIDENKTLFASIFKGATEMLKTVTGVTNAKMPGAIKARYDKMVRPSGTSAANLNSLMTTEIAKNGNDGDYNYIDTSDTISFEEVFSTNNLFNGKINDWDTSNVTSLNHMFYQARAFNSVIKDWDTSKVKTMNQVFSGASTFNQNIENWDVSKVQEMQGMFYKAIAFNQPLEKWNTQSVKNLNQMFNDATAFNQPLSSWNVNNVNTMREMFRGASIFNQDLNAWNDKLINEDLIESLKEASYKSGIFSSALAMIDKNKPAKLK